MLIWELGKEGRMEEAFRLRDEMENLNFVARCGYV